MLSKIIKIAEKAGWSVHESRLEDNSVQLEFSKFTPANQDFNFVATMRDGDIKTLCQDMREYIEGFDPDYEATFWIGDDGHGRRGAPYFIKDIVTDMERAKKMMTKLLIKYVNAVI